MKRYGNLYEKIYSLENIRVAHHNARKGKKHYNEVKEIDNNSEYYFEKIHYMLKNKTFKNAKYSIFTRSFHGKRRKIFKLPYFPDRIVHHCIMQILEPIWKSILIKDTYSSIKGRGLHKGVRRVKEALKNKENTKYCLKLDIRKFYPSVDHSVLKQIIRKKIKCSDTLWLLDKIIDSTSGIPIGNYLSQYFGNIYLSGLDHFLKEERRVKYYFRYCDDLVIITRTKIRLHSIFKAIKKYCSSLKLSIKSNYQLFPIADRGIDFLGYRFFHSFTLLRKSIASRFKRKIVEIKKDLITTFKDNKVNSIMSYWGWIKHGSCKRFLSIYFNKEIRDIIYFNSLLLKQRNPLRRIIV